MARWSSAPAFTRVFARPDGLLSVIADQDHLWRLSSMGKRLGSPTWLGARLVETSPLEDGFVGLWSTQGPYSIDGFMQVIRYDLSGRPVSSGNLRSEGNVSSIAIAARRDGGGVVFGVADIPGGTNSWKLTAFTPSGQKDPTFVAPPMGSSRAEGYNARLAIDGAGRTYLVTYPASRCVRRVPTVYVRRFEPDGSRDRAYGLRRIGLGHAKTRCGGASPTDALIDRAGRLVIVASPSEDAPTAIVRVLPSGRPDRSFGRDGQVSGPRGSVLTQLAEAPNGQIALAGTAWPPTRPAAARLLPSGRFDPRFGVTYGPGSKALPQTSVADVAVDGRGRIVVAGSMFVPSDRFGARAATLWRFKRR